MIWLGEKRGNLSAWTTPVWVRATGREVSLAENDWLGGPTGGIEFLRIHYRMRRDAVARVAG